MPTYPGSPQLTVDALLKQPRLIARALTALTSKRFVTDIIFSHGTPEQVAGGAAWYERSENIFPDRVAEEVGVRSEFPRTGWTEAILTALVHKYGLEAPISFEAIRRNQIDQVARAQRKLANAVTKFVDTQAMTLLTTDAAIQTASTGGTWTSSATTIISDIANARKLIQDQDEGYEADTMVVNPAQELGLLTNVDIRNALPREGGTPGTAVTVGRPIPILGLRQILVSPQLTAGTVLIMNAKVAGTIADEQPDPQEGYVTYDVNAMRAGNQLGGAAGNNIAEPFQPAPNPDYPADFPPIFTKVYTVDGRDEKIVRAARFPAMWLSEPKAVVKITGA